MIFRRRKAIHKNWMLTPRSCRKRYTQCLSAFLCREKEKEKLWPEHSLSEARASERSFSIFVKRVPLKSINEEYQRRVSTKSVTEEHNRRERSLTVPGPRPKNNAWMLLIVRAYCVCPSCPIGSKLNIVKHTLLRARLLETRATLSRI